MHPAAFLRPMRSLTLTAFATMALALSSGCAPGVEDSDTQTVTEPISQRRLNRQRTTADAGTTTTTADSGTTTTADSGTTSTADSGTTTTTTDSGTTTTTTTTTTATGPTVGGCQVFPANNPWNQDVTALPVHPNSAAIIANIQANGETTLKADFGSDTQYGIPYMVVPSTQSLVPVNFTEYGDESDPGPYPVPLTAPIEGGNDHHVLVVEQDTCRLYEMYHSAVSGSGWNAGSGAVFDLTSNALRPQGWTSCDQAGLPIFPGLARYDEVTAGEIRHALRVTFNHTRNGYISPARHPGGSSDVNAPAMGLRLRLRADFDISRYTGQARVILTALRRYGMFVADTGSNWFVSGATDARWNDTDLSQLRNVPGTAFEAVYTGDVQQ
jgi:hypothetical protein